MLKLVQKEMRYVKIINGRELGFMPNGTVFSDIDDNYFGNIEYLDATINGLHILCGHDDSIFPESSGKFNGVLHMLDTVSCHNKEIDEQPDWAIYDTDFNDYDENDYVVVYEKEDIEKIIENLQWALQGCCDDSGTE